MPTASQVNVIAQQIGAMTNQNPLLISGRKLRVTKFFRCQFLDK